MTNVIYRMCMDATSNVVTNMERVTCVLQQLMFTLMLPIETRAAKN